MEWRSFLQQQLPVNLFQFSVAFYWFGHWIAILGEPNVSAVLPSVQVVSGLQVVSLQVERFRGLQVYVVRENLNIIN